MAMNTGRTLYCRKIVHNFFLRLLINEINYVDRFGMVSVRNSHYLSDIYRKKQVFPLPMFYLCPVFTVDKNIIATTKMRNNH